jgi:tetratricopeptide (TPR) repeat protein
MAAAGGDKQLDPLNARLIELHGGRLFPPADFPLDGERLDAAARLYREAAALSPFEARWALARLERARGGLSAALEAAAELAALRPEAAFLELRAQLLAALAERALRRLGSGDAAGAVEDLTSVVTHERQDAGHWINLAAARLRLGHEREAEEAVRCGLELRPESAEGWTTLGLVHERRGELPQAIELLQRAAALAPADARVLLNLGTLQAQAGDARSALVTYLRALELRPDDGPCHNDVAVLYFRQGRVDAARAHAARALALRAPVAPDFLLALSRADSDSRTSAP